MLHHVIKTAEHLVAIRHYALEGFLFGGILCCNVAWLMYVFFPSCVLDPVPLLCASYSQEVDKGEGI